MIAADLLAAYQATTYRLLLEPRAIDLRIGQPAPALDAWLQAQGAPAAALLTAWNPRSLRLEPAENARRQAALLRRLQAAGLRHWPARHLADAGDWPAEDSLLITGLDRAQAQALAQAFDQNAFLWLLPGQAPQLLPGTTERACEA